MTFKTSQLCLMALAALMTTQSWAGKCETQLKVKKSAAARTEIKMKIDSALEAQRQADKIPGLTYAVFDKDSLLLSGELGEATKETHRSIHSEGSLFRIASISKLFTTISVSQLIEKGVFTQETSIMSLKNIEFVEFLKKHETPERLKHWEKITIGHLMSHQAGISKDIPGQIVGFFNTSALQDHSYPSMRGLLPGLLKVEFLYEPGHVASGIKYSNLGMNLLARIVEDSNPDKLSFSDYVKRNIIKPLGMENTFYNLNRQQSAHLVTGYTSSRAPVPFVTEVGSYDGSIGVASSAKDLALLGSEMLKMFFSESRVLTSSQQIENFFQLQSMVTPGLSWARGPLWQTLPKETAQDPLWVGHTGTGPDARTIVLVSPEKNKGIVVLLNTVDANREAYAKIISDLIQTLPVEQTSLMTDLGRKVVEKARQFLTTTPPIQPPVAKAPTATPEQLQKFVGSYYADIVGTQKITLADDGNLVLYGQKLIVEDLAKGEFRFPMIPGPGGILFNAEPVRFKLNSSGEVTGITIANAKYFTRSKE